MEGSSREIIKKRERGEGARERVIEKLERELERERKRRGGRQS